MASPPVESEQIPLTGKPSRPRIVRRRPVAEATYRPLFQTCGWVERALILGSLELDPSGDESYCVFSEGRWHAHLSALAIDGPSLDRLVRRIRNGAWNALPAF